MVHWNVASGFEDADIIFLGCGVFGSGFRISGLAVGI